MGVDACGKNPTDEVGRYFRNNWWCWRPLADYACEVAPEITAACTYWQSNDGDGLDAEGAIKLADALQAEIDAGRTLLYEKKYMGELEAMPNVPCWLCEGTGTRKPPPIAGAGDTLTGVKCNSCDGSGYMLPEPTMYPFGVDHVQEFVHFLRASGGFEIN